MSPKRPVHPSAPRIMGILNVTPDSFSDGGEFEGIGAAVAHGLQMVQHGAQLIDVGGESTRPGAERISEAEQCRRVVPVIEALCTQNEKNGDGPRFDVSIDTTRSAVAFAALDAGATWVNDVSAGLEDPAMLGLVAERGAAVVLMHMRGEPGTMQDAPRYDDVVGEVEGFLEARIQAALVAGVAREKIVIDPGIGFGKTLAHNLALLGALDRFVAMGFPVMLGASRKRLIAQASPATAADRTGGTVATTVLAAQAGVAWVRVHDVLPTRQAIDLLGAVGGSLAETPAEDR